MLAIRGAVGVLVGLFVTQALAQQVRVVAADGQLAASGRVGELRVKPGQVVSLTADEVFVEDDGRLAYGYRDVTDFVWFADDREGDYCDTERDCRATSNFEVTDYGVNFYVPWEAPPRIIITVKSRYAPGVDRVALTVERPAPEAVEDQYLEGLGYWVFIGTTRVFVPIVYEVDWAPYRHGYWYWTAYGWTWYSYDPWGFVTDHCGHWRHSWLYGWVWVPDPVCTWRPAVVTFVFGPGFIGWYPYDPAWQHGYRHGYHDGFDDGYWMGTHVASDRGRRYEPGFVGVSDRDFYVPGDDGSRQGSIARPPDISRARIMDPDRVRDQFREAVAQGRHGPVLGGGQDPRNAGDWYSERTGVRPVETRMKPAWDDSRGRRFLEPEKAPHETPAEYQDVRRRTIEQTVGQNGRTRGVRVPIGARGASSNTRTATRGAARPPSDSGRINEQVWLPRSAREVSRREGILDHERPVTREVDRRDDVGEQRAGAVTGSRREGTGGRPGPEASAGRVGSERREPDLSDETRSPLGRSRGGTQLEEIPDHDRTPKQWKVTPLRPRPEPEAVPRAITRPDAPLSRLEGQASRNRYQGASPVAPLRENAPRHQTTEPRTITLPRHTTSGSNDSRQGSVWKWLPSSSSDSSSQTPSWSKLRIPSAPGLSFGRGIQLPRRGMR